MLSETVGERIERASLRLLRGEDGKLRRESAVVGRMAKWLPNVKVTVCEPCNSGWMSSLEDATKTILAPLILDGASHVRLSRENLLTLATWATKSWMAYALLSGPQQNPFTTEEYRSMAADPRPLDRSQLWLMRSFEPGAEVAMTLNTSLLTFGDAPDLAAAQDNWAYGILSVSTVVLALQLLPADAPRGMDELVAPPMLSSPPVARRIWPDLRPQFFPLDLLPPGALGALLRYPAQIFDALGLPTVGLTDQDATEVLQQYRDGADPRELRRQWDQLD